MPPTPESVPLTEHAARRKKVLSALKDAAGLVIAGRNGEPCRPHPHFVYLTGIAGEPGACLLLDPTHPVPARRQMLFLAPLNRERERWDGYRSEINQALRERTGIESIYRTDMLPRMLGAAARRAKRLACLHPLASHDQPVSPDLAIFRKVAERTPGAAILDRSEVVARMRAVKSRTEVAMIQRAVDITALGFDAMMRVMRPGLNEFDVQEAIEHAYRTGGSRETSFPTIAGGGLNSTVLHYVTNDQPLEDGDLVCVDSGAVWGGYHGDITRTVPVSGRFTERQREIYELVLKAQQASIKAIRPGATLADLDKAARDVIETAGHGDAFIHSIGHHLGLETHDMVGEEPLEQGAVITIEPGVYLPEEKIGVRIEDDVLVTRDGSKVLSSKIPKSVKDVEAAMGRADRTRGTSRAP